MSAKTLCIDLTPAGLAVRVGWIIDALESDIGVDVVAGVNASMRSAVMTTLDFLPVMASSKETLRFAW